MSGGDRAYLAGLVLGLLGLAAVGAIAIPPLASNGDFAEQWAAGRMAVEGGHPYDPATWREGAARLAGRASDAAVFVYPPYVTLALVPLALLPLPVAATVWVGTSLVLAAVAFGALLRAFPPPHPAVATVFGAALLASTPALLALAQGQWDFLLLAAVSWSLAAAARATTPSTTAVALLFKPQLAPLVLVTFARAAQGRGRARFITVTAGALALIGLTVLIVPSWWGAWFQGLAFFTAAPPIRTTTIASTFAALFGPLDIFVVAVVIATVTALGLSLPARRTSTLAVWVASAVVIAPYIQTYDHLLLLAPLAVATSVAAARSHRAAIAVAIVGVALLVFGDLAASATTMERGRDNFGAAIPLLVWGLITGVAWSARASTAPR